MGQNPVDGDGNLRREVTGNETMIRRPEAAEQDTRGLRGFEEISKISPVGIYIYIYISQPCRCDRVEQLGGTEMQNRKRLLQLGVTE